MSWRRPRACATLARVRHPATGRLNSGVRPRMNVFLRLVALLVLVVATSLAAAYVSTHLTAYLFPRILPRPYFEMASEALFGAVTAACISAIPLAKLFLRRAWLGGILVSSPWIALRLSDALHYWGINQTRIMVMSLVELLLYPIFIIGAALAVQVHLRRKDLQLGSAA
jgi:hypothetical protein